jgi:hypothetical protein
VESRSIQASLEDEAYKHGLPHVGTLLAASILQEAREGLPKGAMESEEEK